MTDISEWEALLGGPSNRTVAELEKSVCDSTANYPLLGTEGQPTRPGEPLSWTVRVVLNEKLEENQMKALEDLVGEIVISSDGLAGDQLDSFLETFVTGNECRVATDLNLLRNVAEIKRLQGRHPKIETWVLATTGLEEDDPEHLVGETIRQLTGLLAGCAVLEVRQIPGEDFRSVWHRINVSRLLALESELKNCPEPLDGAGLFSELETRISPSQATI